MNHEAKVIVLQRMIRAVESETRAILAKGAPSPNTNANDALMAKIARWQGQLKGFQSSVKSQAGLVRVRFAQGRKLSFSERQSMKGHRANVAGLRALTVKLAQAIMALLDAMNGPEVAWKHLIKSLDKLIEGGDDLSLTGADQQQLQTIVQQAPGGSQGGYTPSPTGIMDLLTFCIALYVLITRNRKN
ncbi:hypothetical protein [Actibacterium sp. 188UL27-1]|uniref:hypothetical protein n=1 Tax=Actibacterium sp. 188UL27-1 TaxID=2786961 RepID=UPI00195DEFD2|nr:hypothetical protein [Actibacterium sp. 188UL27-1]MBM7068281.1 hypothetical protein [Actibacterium sp. 188UL27-1]